MKDQQQPREPRFGKNVDGPFYTTGCCLACGAPEAEAPDLLAALEGDNFDTYFVRQPSTSAEVARACSALRVCCVNALRYGGRDPEIIRRLGNKPDYTDYVVNFRGRVVQVGSSEDYTRFLRVFAGQHRWALVVAMALFTSMVVQLVRYLSK
jgi:hypothetical protein